MKKVAVIDTNLCDRSPFCPVVRVCKVDAVKQERKFLSASVPEIDVDKCVGCGICVNYCPRGAVSMKKVN